MISRSNSVQTSSSLSGADGFSDVKQPPVEAVSINSSKVKLGLGIKNPLKTMRYLGLELDPCMENDEQPKTP